jgi:hypothetical protein
LNLGQLLPLPPLNLGQLLPLPPLNLGQLLPLPYIRQALDIPLSSIPPTDIWKRVLTGTSLDKPLQAVTLWDVFNDPTTRSRLEQESLGQVVLSSTPLGALGAAGYLLGSVPLAAYHAPQVSCSFFEVQGYANCGQALNPNDSRRGLGLPPQFVMLAGLDTMTLRLHAVPFKDVDWSQGDAPLLRVRLGRQNGGVDLSLASIGSMTMAQLGTRRDAAVNCTGNFVCDATKTLADAQQAGALRTDLTLGTIESAVDAFTIAGDPIPVGQLLVMLLPPNLRPYGVTDIDGLGLAGYAGADAEAKHQTVDVSYAPVGVSAVVQPTVTVTPAAGAPFIPGTATVAVDGGTPSSITPSATGTSLTFTPAVTVAAGSVLKLRLKVRPGLRVGPASVPAIEIAGSAVHQRGDRVARHTVTDNSFDTGPLLADAKAIKPAILGSNGQEGEAAFVFITDADDHQLLTFPAPAAGSRIHVDVEHLSFDADVALYQAPGSASLRPVRPFASTPDVTPVADRATAVSAGNLLAPEAKQDFPFLLTDRVVAGFSNNRGNDSEAIDAYAVDADPGTNYAIQISGYGGASSDKAFTVRVRITPPVDLGPCPPRAFANVFNAGSRGTAPTSVPAGTRSVILTNRSRLQRLYGEAAAQQVMDRLASLAAHPDVAGLVVPVDGWSSLDAAYAAADANPCDPLAANAVNRGINEQVDQLFGPARAQLQFVTIVGSDDVIPHTRAIDLTERVNEQTFAEAAKVGGPNNARSGSFAHSYLLTDDGYADWAPEQWLGGALYVADVAVGRVVESPADITGAIDRALSANLTLQPSTAFTTGYEFLGDGASAVDAALERVLGKQVPDAINEGWTAQNAKDQIGRDRILAVNAHATPSTFLPGAGLPELTSADLDSADIVGLLLLSMGCHANLNLPDATVGVRDFAQTTSGKGAGMVGNTGYGIGYVSGVGLSESVMVEFANRLGQVPIGQALAFGKQAYRATEAIDNVWAAKALEIAGLSGIPQLHLAGATPVPTPASGRGLGVDPVSGLHSEQVTLGGGLQYHRNDVGGESWYDYNARTVQLAGRAVQPEIVEPVLNGATDALITDLVTRVVDDNLDPLIAVLGIIGGGTLSETEPDDPSAAISAAVRSFRAADGDHQQLDVVAGQFLPRGLVNGEIHGQQRVVDGMTVAVLNDNGPSDGNRPVITSTRGVVVDTGAGQNATFEVEAYDIDANGARRPVAGGIVLSIESGPGSMDGAWHRTVLSPDPSNPYRLTGAVPGVTSTTVQYFVQVWDGQLVGVSTSKDAFYQAVALPPPSPDSPLQATAAGAAAGGGFLESATITVSPAEGAYYRIDNGEEQPYTGPFILSTEGVHEVTVRNDADATTIAVPIDNTAPTVVAAPPAVYEGGQQVPTSDIVACRDAGSGVKRCDISPAYLDTAAGGPEQRSQAITVTTEDYAGHVATTTVTYQYTVAGSTLTHEIIGTALPGGFYENPLVRISPTAGTEYRVNGGPWIGYSSPFPVGPPDGIYTVDYRNGSRTGQVVVKVDANAPTTTLAARRTYEAKATAPTAELVTCADQPAGVKRCEVSPPALQTNTVGTGKTQTLHVVAEDNAGHVVTRDLLYTYDVGYRFQGFLAPVDNPPMINRAAAGRTVPIKFVLRDASGALVTNVNQATVTVNLSTVCAGGQTDPEVIGTTTVTGGNQLKWDSKAQQYIYNWVTQKAWDKSCREFKLVLPDGVAHIANFTFK